MSRFKLTWMLVVVALAGFAAPREASASRFPIDAAGAVADARFSAEQAQYRHHHHRRRVHHHHRPRYHHHHRPRHFHRARPVFYQHHYRPRHHHHRPRHHHHRY